MEHSTHGDERIAAEAADWLVQFRDNAGRLADPAAFAEWLTRSPAHIQEFLEVSTLWSAVGTVNPSEYRPEDLIAAARAEQAQPRIVQLSPVCPQADSNTNRVPQMRVRGVSMGIAACVLAGLILCGSWLVSRRGAEITTAVGEQRSITLSDGSVLFLNTNSEVRVRFEKETRNIDLIHGEARFQVARRAQQPFVVATADATIRALGTVFNVAMAKEGTQVAVIEGRVELRKRGEHGARSVSPAPGTTDPNSSPETPKKRYARIELAAGQRAAVTSNGIEPDVGPSIESVNAWTEHRLVVRDKTLAEVVAEFNRYRLQHLVIDTPELAGLRVSGTFDPSDPDSLVAYLGTVEAVEASTPVDGNVHLSRNRK